MKRFEDLTEAETLALALAFANEEEDSRIYATFAMRLRKDFPATAAVLDGSISTLAPIFAAAFATHSTHDTFLVGLAASVGAGISMGLTEAMSDDGAITGRGRPWIRGWPAGWRR